MTLFRADFCNPLPVISHEVAETAGVCIKCVLQESRINAGQSGALREALLEFFQQHHEDECAGIIVRAIAVLVIRKRVDGVLQHSGVIRQASEMIESPYRQSGLAGPRWAPQCV